MDSARKLTRRLLVLSLSGLGLLVAPGCSLSPKSRQLPDHVFSTTTPQMLEHEASGKPIPVKAKYPDERPAAQATSPNISRNESAPAGSTTSDGVVRMNGRPADEPAKLPVADQSVRRVSFEETLKHDEFQFASFYAPGSVPEPRDDGPQFCPAEPRLECNQDGTPLYRMETVAASPLADFFPDEYVYDGGDRDSPAALHASQLSGLDTEDTVAAFQDHTGTARTSASNRVAVYAPRFGSIRTVTHLQADTKVDRAAGAKDSITIGNLKTGNAAQENVHDTVLYGLETRDRLDGMQGSTPPMQARRTDTATQNRKVDEGHEGRAYSGSDTFNRNDGIILAQQMQNATIWTRDEFPVIIGNTTNASDITATFKVQQTVGVEDQRQTKGNIHIVKLADRKEAQSGETVIFTIRFQNSGDFDVYDVRIVDNLTTRLEYVPGTARIDAAHPGEVSVEPNGEGSSILTFTLDNPLKGHESGTITFEAKVR